MEPIHVLAIIAIIAFLYTMLPFENSSNHCYAPVTSLIAGTGITISPESGLGAVTINATPATPIDIEGLQNKLGIFPGLPYSSDTVALASNNDGTPATAIVPDATPPTSSTTPLGTPCWLYTKPSPASICR